MTVTITITSALLYAGLLCAIAVAVVLIRPILWPVIIEFPWEDKSVKESQTVILAGSYNPPHRGHLAMLEYLSKRWVYHLGIIHSFIHPLWWKQVCFAVMQTNNKFPNPFIAYRYGKVIAVVGFNPGKKYQVTPEERANLLRKMLKDAGAAGNVRIEGTHAFLE
jgi:hypothetical protein